ncbi:MAG: hypothetical protein HYV09_38305 [Deltaproteobacteria bacterium]|nr:hypothetical protein [Deltaproteobacteria bacterium]
MRSKILFSVSCVALASCTSTEGPKPESREAVIERVSTERAVRAPGDLVPLSLRATVLPSRAPDATLSGSDPLPVKQTFTVGHVPVRVTARDFRRVVEAGAKDAVSVPIDAPTGARVIVYSAAGPTMHAALFRGVHLRHVETGKVLDLARDTPPTGGKLPDLAPPPKADAELGKYLVPRDAPLSTGLKKAVPAGPLDSALGDAVRLTPEIALFQAPHRMLSIDVPTTPGFVTLDTSEALRAATTMIDVQQPASTIVIGATRSSDLVSFGEEQQVVFDLADQSTPLDGAMLVGQLRTPAGARFDALTFVSLGGGRYSTRVPVVSSDPKHIGTWTIHAKATGTTADGRSYERDIDVPFAYTVPFARMSHVTTPKVVRGKGDLIAEVAVDVDIESVQDARLGLSAVLVVRDAEGKEHPVAIAQTGQDIKAGASVMTLHFGAEALAVANTSGPYYLRELTLVSHGNATTLHRLARGMDLGTVAIKPTELRAAGALKPSLQEAIDLGAL